MAALAQRRIFPLNNARCAINARQRRCALRGASPSRASRTQPATAHAARQACTACLSPSQHARLLRDW